MLRKPNIFFSGLGAITPLGHSARATYQALLAGNTAVHSLQDRAEFQGIAPGHAAIVTGFTLSDHVGGTTVRALHHHDLSLHYAATALQEALTQAGATVAPERTALVVAAGMGGMELHQAHQNAFHAKHQAWLARQSAPGAKVRSREIASPRTVVGIIPNAAAGMLANLHDIRGESLAVSTACASGANAYGVAVRMLLSGEYDRVCVVSCDQVVTPHSMAAFDVLGALAPAGEDPQTMSRPYDVSRAGFLMANGACAYVLETNCQNPLAIHVGYGSRSDGARAEGMVKPAEDGAAVCEAIQACGVLQSGLRKLWVSSHGTSTPIGDIAEARGICRALETTEHRWSVSSIKGSLGHMIGAAPAAAIVTGVLALTTGGVPGTTNLRNVDHELPEAFRYRLLTYGSQACPDAVLVLASGFGGHHAALAFAKVA